MIVISHRGNINGICADTENNPIHIQKLLNTNIPVEIDVWFKNSNFYLGHDIPVYRIETNFLRQKNLWCHAKNIEAFEQLLKINALCFWHQTDDYTLTSNGFIWTYPSKTTCAQSIIVDLSNNWKSCNYTCYGVCTDYQ